MLAGGYRVARALLRALRPKQWTKNGLLFVGLLFSFKLGELHLLATVVFAFIIFCALSSAVYLINDLKDVEKDRLHPTKRLRPIAAGILPPRVAAAAAAILLLAAIPAAYWINTGFGAIASFYVILVLLYTYWLKNVVIMDVLLLAAGFVMRAAAGAVAIAVPISPWLYVCTILGALFLGVGKRRHELVSLDATANSHRPILEEYTPELLDQMMSVVTSALVMAYSLYTFSAPNLPANHAMMLTIPFVLYGVFRYLYLIHVQGSGGSPEEILLRDKPIMAVVVLYLLTSVFILYVWR